MEYSLNARVPAKAVRPSTLRLGGSNPNGDRIGFTNYYMELNGRPYFAICGEFHYSRYPEAEWETELRKMRATGINVVATYIFWNHHEEKEGAFDWRGNRDLRRFIELSARCGLYAILRVGPFCHGEARNGGLPDWLFGREFDVRSNDEGYLAYVNRLYREIGRQARGLMFKDGGPVIGVQLENEFNAAAALWELTAKQGDEYLSGGTGGAEHMRLLKQMAVEAGLEAPIYTSTGWGNAPFLQDEVLPLYGGYAYTPWTISEHNPHQQPTGEYVFADFHNDEPAAAGEFHPPYPRTAYPYACCEMGGGMQTWYLARFRVEPESVAAMSLVKIAGGCNFLGYYMYHGGTNPVGETGYLNESTTPRITYDFQATIGEFGQIRPSNDLVRPLHYFLRQFGERLAPMATVLPEGAAGIRPEDAETLRYAVRTDGKSGFLFINNYQDHVAMRVHEDVRFAIECGDGALRFPQRTGLTIRPGASMMLPLHFDLDGADLLYATAQPVTRASSAEASAYFFRMSEGVDGEFAFGEETVKDIACHDAGTAERDAYGGWIVTVPHDRSARIRLTGQDGRDVYLYAMTAAEAARLWEVEIGGLRRIFFSELPLAADGDGIVLNGSLAAGAAGEGRFTFREYAGPGSAAPVAWSAESAGLQAADREDGWFRSYSVTVPLPDVRLDVRRIHDRKVALSVGSAIAAIGGRVSDVLLSVDYTGNVGYAFSGGELLHDHFHNGAPWEIGLSRFRDRIRDGRIVLETTPLRRGVMTVEAGAGMAAEQTFVGEQAAEFRDIEAIPILRIRLRANAE
ncbi:beta-galactosidase [Cohnella caldifontis]|uniref:beta-galactosidase n=1 Tax=Cohnella caldifontis TaxID=3027471 RepID=UPI0023EAE43D|nr:beta-galactosidase [Cohnella sp. YIM B05605]